MLFGFLFGIYTVLFILFVWWYWTTQKWRFSIERIGGMLKEKYTYSPSLSAILKKSLSEKESSVVLSNVKINKTKTKVSGIFQQKNNRSKQLLLTTPFVYDIKTNFDDYLKCYNSDTCIYI